MSRLTDRILRHVERLSKEGRFATRDELAQRTGLNSYSPETLDALVEVTVMMHIDIEWTADMLAIALNVDYYDARDALERYVGRED